MYGPGQAPLEIGNDKGTVHGKAPDQGYEQHLEQFRGQGPQRDQDRGIDR